MIVRAFYFGEDPMRVDGQPSAHHRPAASSTSKHPGQPSLSSPYVCTIDFAKYNNERWYCLNNPSSDCVPKITDE